MQLAVHGMPKGTGKKGSHPSRKRARKESIEGREERFPATQATSTNQCASANPISITIGSGTHVSPTVQQACSSASASMDVLSPESYYHPCLLPCAPYPSYPPSYPPSYFPPVFSPSTAIHRPTGAVTQSPFFLVFITGNISVCAGCSGHYMKPATPPYDLCIKHTEWRQFKINETPKSKFAPAYYHVNLPCLQANWPSFCVSSLTIQPDIFQKLTDVHIDFLRAFGCYIWYCVYICMALALLCSQLVWMWFCKCV